MNIRETDLPFNKGGMSADDLKRAADALQQILCDFDNFHDMPDELVARVAQVRGYWYPYA